MSAFLPSVYFVKITNGGAGLTNQMLSIVCSVIRSLFLNKKAVAIDTFCTDFKNDTHINISDIIDLKKTNAFLKEKYNIVLLDKNTMHFTLHNVYAYNKTVSLMNLTMEMQKYICNGHLCIPANQAFYSENDPTRTPLCLSMNYSLDNYAFFDNFTEKNTNAIASKIESNECGYDFALFEIFIRTMPQQVNEILKNIHFQQDIIPTSILENNIFNQYEKVNIIHLRLEEDALQHWGKMNNMRPEYFKKVIENKYIQLIEQYFQKNELIGILTYSTENPVVEFLKNNGYVYFYLQKDENRVQRELCAIKDLFLSTKCNHIYIGNFCTKYLNGSTFSYYILQKLENPNVKKVMINLDRILDKEEIFYTISH